MLSIPRPNRVCTHAAIMLHCGKDLLIGHKLGKQLKVELLLLLNFNLFLHVIFERSRFVWERILFSVNVAIRFLIWIIVETFIISKHLLYVLIFEEGYGLFLWFRTDFGSTYPLSWTHICLWILRIKNPNINISWLNFVTKILNN